MKRRSRSAPLEMLRKQAQGGRDDGRCSRTASRRCSPATPTSSRSEPSASSRRERMANWMGGSAPAMASQVPGGFVLLSTAPSRVHPRRAPHVQAGAGEDPARRPGGGAPAGRPPRPAIPEPQDQPPDLRPPGGPEPAHPAPMSIGALATASRLLHRRTSPSCSSASGWAAGSATSPTTWSAGRDLPWWAGAVLDRRHRDEHRHLPEHPRLRLHRRTSPGSSSPMGFLLGRLLVVACPAAAVLHGRVLHRLRGAPRALRRSDHPDRVAPVHRHPQPGRRAAAVPDRDRAPGGGGDLRSCGPWS